MQNRFLVAVAIIILPFIVITKQALAQAIAEFMIPTADSAPTGITAGPDGALWFTEQAANKIGRITSGNVAIWFMNGAQVTSSVGVGNVPTTWSIVGTGDFNGDGKSDILWRDSGGDVAVWLMNGAQLSQSAGVGNVPTAWSIQGVNAD